jgi:hypothetical protein
MARLRCLEPFLCEREGPLVIPGGCFVCGAAGGGICLFRSPASRLVAADSPSPLVLAASVADSHSTSLIRLEGCSRRWLLRCSQGLELICRSGGGFLLAPLCAGVSGRGERGHYWRKEEDLVVICLFFRVLVVIWGCIVHLFKYIHPFCKKKKLLRTFGLILHRLQVTNKTFGLIFAIGHQRFSSSLHQPTIFNQ